MDTVVFVRRRNQHSFFMLPEIEKLLVMRREKGWSNRRLVNHMASYGIVISENTLDHACRANEQGKGEPSDRTLYKIRQYLALVEPPAVRARPRRRRSSRAGPTSE